MGLGFVNVDFFRHKRIIPPAGVVGQAELVYSSVAALFARECACDLGRRSSVVKRHRLRRSAIRPTAMPKTTPSATPIASWCVLVPIATPMAIPRATKMPSRDRFTPLIGSRLRIASRIVALLELLPSVLPLRGLSLVR
jgi:hypothetical protein